MEWIPIKKTDTASAGWADAPTKFQTVVSFGETADSFNSPEHTEPVRLPRQAEPGHVLRSRYRLDEVLAVRPGAKTWRGFDLLLSRPVLVHLLDDAPANESVLAAAKRAAVAGDFRVLRVLDATPPTDNDGTDESWIGPYIVCEYAPGKSLEDLLAAGPISAMEAAWLVREVAEALTDMHAAGLFHERITPTTVVVTESGNVKIVGFLLEAELDPDQPQIHDPQQADVTALGALLYAMLTSRCPGGAGFGMPVAPTGPDGFLLPASAIQPGVPPSLDQIADRILNPTPRGGATPLRTAADVSATLSQLLGTADSAQDLELRVRASLTADADQTLEHHVPEDFPVTAPLPTAQLASVAAQPPARTPKVPGHYAQPKQAPRWLRVLLPIALIAVLIAGAAIGTRFLETGDSAGHAEAPAAAASTQWSVVAAKDFDPEGNGEEHPNEVNRAWDGDPNTSWTTMNYFEAEIGNKTGVGLVFDLGEVRRVSKVELDLDGNGTSLEVRVPAADGATAAPMSGIDQWRQVGTAMRTPAATQITLDQPVETRFVLIYFTELPPAGGQFTGGIAEARFWG